MLRFHIKEFLQYFNTAQGVSSDYIESSTEENIVEEGRLNDMIPNSVVRERNDY